MPFVDLGSAPPSNAYLTVDTLNAAEKWYPLRVWTCTDCWLVQTEDYAEGPELFSAGYAYYSSYSTTWLQHAETYVDQMVDRFKLGPSSRVVEVACNDGYLLQYVAARGISCLGVEPTAGAAGAARQKGIEVVEEFFGYKLGRKLARTYAPADLIVANNVLAHVPAIDDFLAGFAALLKADGVATFEFPHVLRMVRGVQFDTIYHEHFSYLSLTAVLRIFDCNGLAVFDVEELPTHGGSLRVYAQRRDSGCREIAPRVAAQLKSEIDEGMHTPAFYSGFQDKVNNTKNGLLTFLLDAKRSGRTVVAYGAAAKGNTLLNFAGVRPDLLPFVVDRNPAKQGKFMPGSRIPITNEERLEAARPDYIVVLPWNLRSEIMAQLRYAGTWGCTFVTAVPTVRTYPADVA